MTTTTSNSIQFCNSNMKSFKLIVAGSRNYHDPAIIKSMVMDYVDTIAKNCTITIISGGAKGVDSIGEKIADEMGWQKVIIKPDWGLGRGAGPSRNTEMAKIADGLIAFWDGKSHGTKDMIRKANQKHLHVKVVEV